MTSRKLRKSPGAGFGQYPDSVFNQQGMEELHPQLVKQARSSGQLNLSNRGLVAVPTKVWTIGELDKEEQRKVSQISMDSQSDENWWEQVDMTKLILACNKISEISPQISNLLSLQVLDLHDNQLSCLPASLGQLVQLTKLNVSHNRLTQLPDCLSDLKELRVLQANNNQIEELDEGIGSLVMLANLDLANNKLKSLPGGIGFLSFVTNLNLSSNQLTELPPEMNSMTNLTSLELTNNQIRELPSTMDGLTHLELLYLRHNRLTRLPTLTNCINLKELHLGNNKISSVTGDDLEGIQGVKILELRENSIPNLPTEVIKLQVLERLDLTNNCLSNLPPSMGLLPHLKSVQLEGNPMKSIRRDIMARGTVGLLKYLRSRMEEDEIAELAKSGAGNVSPVPLSSSPPVPDVFSMKTNQSLNLSMKGLTELPTEAVQNALEAKVQSIDLSKNQLVSFPANLEEVMPQLYEVNIASNKIPQLPGFIAGDLIQFLDLSNNKLSSLPDEMGGMKHLREIILSVNQFETIPSCLFSCAKLETILIANNKVASIEVERLKELPNLAILDLQNNAIQTVPPQLGNVTQLRQLKLEGNLFRVPRAAILVQGTGALMAYLRDRIPK